MYIDKVNMSSSVDTILIRWYLDFLKIIFLLILWEGTK